MSYVRVQKQQYGSVTFGNAVADVFDTDTLTVSWADPSHNDGEPAMVFKPGMWRDATVYDDRDNVLASFISSDEQRAQDAAFTAAKGRAS